MKGFRTLAVNILKALAGLAIITFPWLQDWIREIVTDVMLLMAGSWVVDALINIGLRWVTNTPVGRAE